MQIQEHLEGPIGMALYEWKDGKIGNVCVQGGELHLHCPWMLLKEGLPRLSLFYNSAHILSYGYMVFDSTYNGITGPKGEGGLDDATGAGGTGASNMKQTSAVVNLGEPFPWMGSHFEYKCAPSYKEFLRVPVAILCASTNLTRMCGWDRGCQPGRRGRFIWDGIQIPLAEKVRLCATGPRRHHHDSS